MNLERMTILFRRWSEVEAVSNLSPLYAVLGNVVADDSELLAMAAEALPGQPPPNILFAAVHALLATCPEEPLAAYYPSLGGQKPADAAAGAAFRAFCLANRERLLPVIRTRLVQTNEVRRSALLLPAFASVADETHQPLALFEIGPSAGLNLNFERYHYRYGTSEAGDPNSPVTLECEPKGSVPEVVIPEVASRLGVDINPLDVTDPDDVAWLTALLWPEHTDRLALMRSAIAIARSDPPPLIRGDIFELLPPLIEATPRDHAVGVFATFVLVQFSLEMRARLREMLLELSIHRPLHFVVIGSPGFVEPGSQLAGEEQVWLLRLRNGAGEYRVSSVANPHGRWIRSTPGPPWKPWLASA